MRRQHMRRQLVASGAAITAGVVVAVLASGLPSAGAPNPPGNNGTIKIDNPPFDDHPNNEPHVDCVFQVDFYGYDEGNLNADVTFRAHPPTGDKQVLLTDTVFIGEDDNSGGGSEAGLDASETYVLDFTGITPHPVQGFHVKLTINADGSQGADKKHKVFWVTDCPPPPPNGNGNGNGNGDGNGNGEKKKSTETPIPVPTSVPAGANDGGSGSAGLFGLVLAGSAAVAGAAVVAGRRFLHDS